MSLALTTTHENGIFRGVAMSVGTPRRMKMTSRYPATKQRAYWSKGGSLSYLLSGL